MRTRMNSNLTAAYLIDIIYTMPAASTESLAASSVTHPTNIANKFKFSQQELIEYNDFIETVVSIILHNGFDIIDEKQSGESYSYYITFYPTDEDGQRWDESVQIRFRIANHTNKGAESQDSLSSRRADRIRTKRSGVTTCVKSFELGTAKYPGKLAIYKGVREVCNNLRYGDYSDFD